MKFAKVIGALIIIAGVAALLFSNYLNEQIAEGNIKIEKGQKAVNQGNQLFSLSPYTQQVGKGLTNSSQKKINSGKEQIAYYQQMADNLHTGGIVAIVVGAGIVLYGFMGKKKKRR